MKTIIASIIISALMCGGAYAQHCAKGLQVVRGLILSDTGGTTPDDLRVQLWVKNVGEKDITVLTRNLQFTLFNYTDKPKELSINLSTHTKIDGSPVIPSFYGFSPVTLKEGEIAEIQLVYRDKKSLERVVLIYDMRNDIATRFNAWDGIVRSDVIEVKKVKRNR